MDTNGLPDGFHLRLLRLASPGSPGFGLLRGLIPGPKSEAGLAGKIAHPIAMLAPN
jgi:hypothetical protein